MHLSLPLHAFGLCSLRNSRRIGPIAFYVALASPTVSHFITVSLVDNRLDHTCLLYPMPFENIPLCPWDQDSSDAVLFEYTNEEQGQRKVNHETDVVATMNRSGSDAVSLYPRQLGHLTTAEGCRKEGRDIGRWRWVSLQWPAWYAIREQRPQGSATAEIFEQVC
jgi:hypothetical protein